MRPRLQPLVPLAALLGLAGGCPVEYVVPLEEETLSSTNADSDGSEAGECALPMLECFGDCIDPDVDDDHCGECGEDCGPGGTCVAGDCVDACGDSCDRNRELCIGGTCECRVGFTRCGDVCVDLDTNPAFCGECSENCLDDDDDGDVYVCEAGICFDDVGCSVGLTQCGQSCVDLQTHPLHCDECGRACDGDEVCIGGECEDL